MLEHWAQVMSALGLDEILNLVHEYGGADNAEPRQEQDHQDGPQAAQRGRRPLGRGLAQRNRLRRAGVRQSALKKKQLAKQTRCFNQTGQARTLDHQLPDEDLGRQSVAGKGRWKTWTAEAVLRAGFGSETATVRQLANEVEGASGNQARAARFVCANAVCVSQEQGCQKVVAESRSEPLRHFVRNLMFDESTFDLKVGKDPATSCSVLCSHAQWTMSFAPNLGESQPGVRDEHIVRPPEILAPMNSATMWKAEQASRRPWNY